MTPKTDYGNTDISMHPGKTELSETSPEFQEAWGEAAAKVLALNDVAEDVRHAAKTLHKGWEHSYEIAHSAPGAHGLMAYASAFGELRGTIPGVLEALEAALTRLAPYLPSDNPGADEDARADDEAARLDGNP